MSVRNELKNVKVCGNSMPGWVANEIVEIQQQESIKNRQHMSLSAAMVYLIKLGIKKYNESIKDSEMGAL